MSEAPIYCNPLPIPDYPRGSWSHRKEPDYLWIDPAKPDFREMADPSVLHYDGKWYLYPSCGMAWTSDDMVNWEHHRIEPYDCGYAPTVVKFRDQFLLTACGTGIWQANHPLGPFHEIGSVLLPDGTSLQGNDPFPSWRDPMLFADDDGKLYGYWGLGKPGIFGVELDPSQPNRMRTLPQRLFGFDPAHIWERFGEYNENKTISYVEGAWMVKINGIYYLTYSAPGTSCRTYAMGCYVGEKPLGPFRYQSRNPILAGRGGLVNGPGHGCIVRGPKNTLWAFYTCTVRNINVYERRIGMDPAGFDADGNLYVAGASETPQWAPGVLLNPELGNDAGLTIVNVCASARASSYLPGREPCYAVDNSLRTFWQADPADPHPAIWCQMFGSFRISAMRICWAEPGLNYDGGVMPGPFQYRLEYSSDGETWAIALDRTGNRQDLLVDIQAFAPVTASWARLVVTGHPRGICAGILQWTLFGVLADAS